MRTDGQTDMTKLIVTFRNSADAPKNLHFCLKTCVMVPVHCEASLAAATPCRLQLCGMSDQCFSTFFPRVPPSRTKHPRVLPGTENNNIQPFFCSLTF
jgi:hypothetical protein